MSDDGDIEELRLKIEMARAYARRVFEGRARLAGVLSGTFATGYEVEFPEPDIMHVHVCMFGHRIGEQPAAYRLSFGHSLKWVGVSHPWGLKLADIVVADDSKGAA